jgi:hypothetical protein
MKTPTQSISWFLSMALFGVVVLAFFLLILTGALPVSAALQSLMPEAITNPQTAAILGGQNLLVFQQISHSIYLPAVIR